MMTVRFLGARQTARWLAPLAVIAVILGGGAAARALAAGDRSVTPPASASNLIADLATTNVDGIQGTVVEHADLGLPELPTGGRADFPSLISGTHTIKVWFAGPAKTRVAVLGDLTESDLVHNGSDVWLWSSAKNTVAHATVPAGATALAPFMLPRLPVTPQEAATMLLKVIAPSTSVTVADNVTVAGRVAYQLVIAPRDRMSLVDHISVAIDAANHVPLRVQVFAKGYAPPAFEVAFTQISFVRPSDQVFAFTPPPGAKVTDLRSHSGTGTSAPARPRIATTGSAWTTILAARPAQPVIANSGLAKALLDALPTVHGGFGTGKLLATRLVTVLFLDDGRIIVGAVSPAAVVAAAADPKLALPR